MKLVPVTEEEKRKSYYKYFLRPMAQFDAALYDEIDKGPKDYKNFLPIHEMDRLLDPDAKYEEFGYCLFPDGTGALANTTKMPGVTPEMLDWWFAWHGIEPLRYKIWDPEEHYEAASQNIEQNKDATLSMKERYWNTVHYTREAFGSPPPGFPVPEKPEDTPAVPIRFIPPVDFGFDAEKLKDFDGTIICGGGLKDGISMCHMLCRGENGDYELRTRFWFGWRADKGTLTKMLPNDEPFPLPMMAMLLKHNIKEFSNLAALLPDIYPEEKDNF